MLAASHWVWLVGDTRGNLLWKERGCDASLTFLPCQCRGPPLVPSGLVCVCVYGVKALQCLRIPRCSLHPVLTHINSPLFTALSWNRLSGILLPAGTLHPSFLSSPPCPHRGWTRIEFLMGWGRRVRVGWGGPPPRSGPCSSSAQAGGWSLPLHPHLPASWESAFNSSLYL